MLDQHVQRPFLRRHPVVTAAAATTLTWWLWQGWYEAVALVVVVGLFVVVRRRRHAAAIRDAGLRARADYENRLSAAGDPRGLYGRYTPAWPNWYPDPQNPCRLRYFDGAAWTPHIRCR